MSKKQTGLRLTEGKKKKNNTCHRCGHTRSEARKDHKGYCPPGWGAEAFKRHIWIGW